MPKCSMAPPIASIAAGNHVAPVGDRGGAEHDHQLGAEPEQFLDRLAASAPRHAARGARR
jgi:hypothetical protein